jgi:NADH:ubiquinone oxidoreductase subunit K
MAPSRVQPVSAGLVQVLFVAAAMVAAGALAAGWRRDLVSALGAIPLLLGGAGVAFVGVERFAAAGAPQLVGQEFAVLLGVASLALVALGVGIAGREGSR